MLSRYFTFSFLFFISLMQAQESVGPALYNTDLILNPLKKISSATAKDVETISLPFVDDFSRDNFIGNEQGNPVLWTDRYAYRNNTWAVNPPTIGVATFDGADTTGYPYDWGSSGAGVVADTLTSSPIDLNFPESAGIGLSFYYQPGGLGFLPGSSAGDSLILEFYSPNLDQWFQVWSTLDVQNTEFEFVYIPITQDRYLQTDFRFRFKNYAQLEGPVDLWHIDYVWLDQNNVNESIVNNDVAFVRQENTLLNEYSAMPWEHYQTNPSGFMRDDISLLIRNLNDGPRTLENNYFRVSYEGALIGDYANPNNPQIAAQNILEYQNPIGNSPNSFFYSADEDASATFEVSFNHGVADFDPTASNDTMHFLQEFSDYYAYDDGTAEVSYQQESGGSIALRFTNHMADSIWAARLFFMPVYVNQEQSNFVLTLWEDGGNGPGEVIAEAYHTVEYGQEMHNQFMTYAFDEPIFLPAGNFYLGYRQPNDELNIGLDRNRDINTSHLYYTSNGAWSSSGIEGVVMIRAIMQTLDYVSGIEETFLPDLNIYPNPTSDQVNIQTAYNKPLEAKIFDVSGKLIKSAYVSGSSVIDVSDIKAGMYILQITDISSRFTTSKKLIIKN